MSSSIPVNTKKRGRPPGRDYPVTVAVRLKSEQTVVLDAWREAQPKPKPSRSEAIRRLMELSLQAAQGPDPQDGRSDGA